MPIEVFEFSNSSLDYNAWISVDSLRSGMSFGGCRFSKSVTKDEVVRLADCMTKKLMYHGLPVGGAKTGLRVDPSRPDMGKVLLDFAQQARSVLADKVMIGKDLGATNEIIDQIYDYAGFAQTHIVSRHTGRRPPNRLREFTGYINHMTAQGMVWAAQAVTGVEALKKSSVIIQGAGAVGKGSFFRFNEIGAKIIGINDQDKGWFNPQGIAWQVAHDLIGSGKIAIENSRELVERDSLLSQDCDLLVLAANSSSVGADLAESIRAKIVLEGSNFGLTNDARAVLARRNIMVIPDILANSSSAALVALQMASANSYSGDEIWRKIRENIQKVCEKTLSVSKLRDITMLDAYVDWIFPELRKSITEEKFN